MRLPLVSAFIPLLVAADSLSNIVHEYSTISCSDTAGFSNWLANYSGQVESHYKSIYGIPTPASATDSMHTSMASSFGGGILSAGSHSDHGMTAFGEGTTGTSETTGNSGNFGNFGNSETTGNSGSFGNSETTGNSGAPAAGATLTFTGMAGQQAPFFIGTGGLLGVAIAGVSILCL